jgi:hypothetical protein
MMASHDFQESLKNYFDLAELEKRLKLWGDYIGAYEDIIRIRADYYEPLLPEIEAKFRALDSKMKLRIEQRDKLNKRLKKMLIARRPDFLTTADERVVLQKLDRLDAQLKNREKASNKTRQRIARLKGVITWNIHTQYQERFTKATEHLHELDKHVKKLKEIYNEFVRTRQAATQSYKGYDKQLQRLRIKIRQAQEKVQVLMARQGHMIEVMAINELELRRKRLEEYQVKARFAMAESYDRATKKKQEQQIEKDREKLQQEQQQQSTTEKEAKPRQTEKQQEDVANSSSDQPNPQPASSAK